MRTIDQIKEDIFNKTFVEFDPSLVQEISEKDFAELHKYSCANENSAKKLIAMAALEGFLGDLADDLIYYYQVVPSNDIEKVIRLLLSVAY